MSFMTFMFNSKMIFNNDKISSLWQPLQIQFIKATYTPDINIHFLSIGGWLYATIFYAKTHTHTPRPSIHISMLLFFNWKNCHNKRKKRETTHCDMFSGLILLLLFCPSEVWWLKSLLFCWREGEWEDGGEKFNLKGRGIYKT